MIQEGFVLSLCDKLKDNFVFMDRTQNNEFNFGHKCSTFFVIPSHSTHKKTKKIFTAIFYQEQS